MCNEHFRFSPHYVEFTRDFDTLETGNMLLVLTLHILSVHEE